MIRKKYKKNNFHHLLPQKTTAYRRLIDDVPHEVKIERLNRMVKIFRKNAQHLNESLIGTTQLILIEDVSKRSPNEIYGRNDGSTKVIIPNSNGISIGDYVAVDIISANSQVLKGKMIEKVSLSEFYKN